MTNATSGLIGAGFSTILGVVSGLDNAKKQRELQEKLAKLSLEQKTQLEKRMQDMNSASERQRILFQALALEKNSEVLRETNKDRNIGLFIVGIGILSLAGVIFLARKKTNG